MALMQSFFPSPTRLKKNLAEDAAQAEVHPSAVSIELFSDLLSTFIRLMTQLVVSYCRQKVFMLLLGKS